MLKTNVMDRGSGKTKLVATKMKENPNSIVLLHFQGIKEYFIEKNPDLQDRVYTFRDIGFKPDTRYSEKFVQWLKQTEECSKPTIFVDEGFLLSSEETALFYYKLGQLNMNVEVFGTDKDLNADGIIINTVLKPSLLQNASSDRLNELIVVQNKDHLLNAIKYLKDSYSGEIDFKIMDKTARGKIGEHQFTISTLKDLERGYRFSSVRYLNFTDNYEGDK